MKFSKLALVSLVALTACGGGKDSDSKSSSSSSSKADVPIDVAGVNALVPASLKDKLTFEAGKIVEERGRHNRTYALATPKGWVPGMKGFAGLKPPDSAKLGFMTTLDVGINCDGTCEPKDWAAVSEKVNFKQFRDGGKIVKDDVAKNSHLMIAEKGDNTYVEYAWWDDGEREYKHCSATLDKDVKDAAPAFAKACQAVTMSDD